jgi:hypothetical protein
MHSIPAVTHGFHLPVPAPSTHENLADIPLSLSANPAFTKDDLSDYISQLDDAFTKPEGAFGNHEGKQVPKVLEHLSL